MVAGLLETRRGGAPFTVLSPREREVLGLIAEGLSNKGIGERVMITEGAVQKHVTSIFTKLGLPGGEDANRRVLAVLAYLNPDRRRAKA